MKDEDPDDAEAAFTRDVLGTKDAKKVGALTRPDV